MKFLQKSDMKPCGCGEGEPVLTDEPLCDVTCSYCGIGVHGFGSPSQAIEAWNRIYAIEKEYPDGVHRRRPRTVAENVAIFYKRLDELLSERTAIRKELANITEAIFGLMVDLEIEFVDEGKSIHVTIRSKDTIDDYISKKLEWHGRTRNLGFSIALSVVEGQ